MKGLSVRQPYASLIAIGAKRLEARSRHTGYRGALLIHASSAAVTEASISQLEDSRLVMERLAEVGWTSRGAIKDLPRSAIIGIADLTASVVADDMHDASPLDFSLSADPNPDVVYWVIKSARACEPVTVNGKLNVWDLPVELEATVSSALDRAASRAPAWTKPTQSGDSLQLREFIPDETLSGLIGSRARTVQEVLNDLQAYCESHNLLTASRLKVDTELSFLAPGRKFLSFDDAQSAVSERLTPVKRTGGLRGQTSSSALYETIDVVAIAESTAVLTNRSAAGKDSKDAVKPQMPDRGIANDLLPKSPPLSRTRNDEPRGTPASWLPLIQSLCTDGGSYTQAALVVHDGDPVEVRFVIEPIAIHVELPVVEWRGQTPLVYGDRRATIPTQYLPEDSIENELRAAVALVRAERQARFQECQVCHQRVPPEWMMGGLICQGCAQRQGVVF